MRGKLEAIRDGNVVGWIWNEQAPRERVAFALRVDDRTVHRGVADLPRGDLARKSIGDGAHAFRVPLDPSWLLSGATRLILQVPPDLPQFISELQLGADAQAPAPPQLPVHRPAPPLPADAPHAGPALSAHRERSADLTVQRSGGSSFGAASAIPAPGALVRAAPAPVSGGARPPADAEASAEGRSAGPDLSSQPVSVSEPVATAPVQSLSAPRPFLPDMLVGEEVSGLVEALLAGGGWTERQLVDALAPLVEARLWGPLAIVFARLPAHLRMSEQLMAWHGRVLVGLQRDHEAIEVLSALKSMAPKRHGDLFYLGLAYARLKRWREALVEFANCLRQDFSRTHYLLESARAMTQIGFGAYGAHESDPRLLDQALVLLQTAYASFDSEWRIGHELASLLAGLGHAREAHEVLTNCLARTEKVANVHSEAARLALRLGDMPLALEQARQAAVLDPAGDSIRFNLRLLQGLREMKRARSRPRLAPLPEGVAGAVLTEDAEWFVAAPLDHAEAERWIERCGFDWAAGIREAAARSPVIWRRAFFVALIEAGLVRADEPVAILCHVAGRLGRLATMNGEAGGAAATQAVAPADREIRGTVLLLSRHGSRRFGGGEHFIAQMAGLYREMGCQVIIAGAGSHNAMLDREEGGIAFAEVSAEPAALLRFVVEQDVGLVHVISGMVLETVTALRWLNIRLIHGVHFWRDMLIPPTPSPGYYPDLASPGRREEFEMVVQEADVLYANSIFTRDLIETHFGLRAPILESRPDDRLMDAAPTPDGRDEVLLINSRSEKGFGLFVRLAQALPDIRFRAVASQSDRSAAEAAAEQAGVANLTIQDAVEDLAPLYERARVVCVPSFRFVESFSRVVLEAQRFGVPVLGADRGNIPNLLAVSGKALPEDASLWAEEIRALFADDALWRERSLKSLAASAARPFSEQGRRLGRFVSAVRAPLLVAVGSGLGNILHTTPLIRFLSRKLGHPVDVLVAGDHPGLTFVPSHPEHVSHVFSPSAAFAGRRYERVLITNSFGQMVPPLACAAVLKTRDVDVFAADHALHESEFNLYTASRLLDLTYTPEDVRDYFVGDYVYSVPPDTLVGLHAGSKSGIWATKRWPHFAALARVLIQRGVRVASFGTPDEYVEGTLDLTGGSIEEMTRRMMACSHFVANDSGVMNIANALGIPLVALFGPTNARTRGPLSPKARILEVAAPCAPCEMIEPYRKHMFREGTCRCIEHIPVEAVVAALRLKP